MFYLTTGLYLADPVGKYNGDICSCQYGCLQKYGTIGWQGCSAGLQSGISGIMFVPLTSSPSLLQVLTPKFLFAFKKVSFRIACVASFSCSPHSWREGFLLFILYYSCSPTLCMFFRSRFQFIQQSFYQHA